jgi:hypothetical protein
MSTTSIKISTKNTPNEAVQAIGDALTKQFDARNIISQPKTQLSICKSTHLLAHIVVVEFLCETAALMAVEIRVMAVDRRAAMKTTDVDHLGARVEGQNDPKEQDPRASGPRTCSVGVGRGLAAVLGRWSCG